MAGRRWIWVGWLAALPLFWLSGWVCLYGPDLLQGALGIPVRGPVGVLGATAGAHPWPAAPGVQISGLLAWLVLLLVRVSVLGLALSLLARALGPASLRTLLTPRQTCWIGVLASALVWAALTGYVWASLNGDETGAFIWQVILGAAADLFFLAWLVLGVRAAASAQPQRTGWLLLGSGVLAFFSGIGGLTLLNTLQPALNLFTVGLWAFFYLGLVLMPPLATAGVAALATGLWPLLPGGRRRGVRPAPQASPKPGTTRPSAPEQSAGTPPAAKAPEKPATPAPENPPPAPEPPSAAEEPLPPPNGHRS